MSKKLYIKLDKITFHGKHGVTQIERAKPQPIEVTLSIQPKSKKVLLSDTLIDTIDYLDIYSKVKKNIEEKSFKLLESLAHEIINDIAESSPIKSIKLSIRKPAIKIDNNQDFIEVILKAKM